MAVNPNTAVSIAEAIQDFSRVARIVDEQGSAVILRNDVPRYLIVEYSQTEGSQSSPDEDVLAISERLIRQNRKAYEELAK